MVNAEEALTLRTLKTVPDRKDPHPPRRQPHLAHTVLDPNRRVKLAGNGEFFTIIMAIRFNFDDLENRATSGT